MSNSFGDRFVLWWFIHTSAYVNISLLSLWGPFHLLIYLCPNTHLCQYLVPNQRMKYCLIYVKLNSYYGVFVFVRTIFIQLWMQPFYSLCIVCNVEIYCPELYSGAYCGMYCCYFWKTLQTVLLYCFIAVLYCVVSYKCIAHCVCLYCIHPIYPVLYSYTQ